MRMKIYLIIIVVLSLNLGVTGATAYYIAPVGSNTNTRLNLEQAFETEGLNTTTYIWNWVENIIPLIPNSMTSLVCNDYINYTFWCNWQTVQP